MTRHIRFPVVVAPRHMQHLWLLALLLIGTSESSHAAEPPTKPNIILILGDDVGIGNIGCYGGPLATPHLDALAAGGTRFEHCYSSPLCGPSRAMLLTGRYGFRTGMSSNLSAAADHRDEIMLPRVLKPAGYVTALVGKWSNHWLEPDDWGFDEYLRTKGGGKYWSSQVSSYLQNGKQVPLGDRYLPDVMDEFLVDYLTRHRDRPLFALYSLAQMHAKLQRTPDSKSKEGDFYEDNNAYMDKLVGRLVATLERLGLREKTLVIFTGDNGTSIDGATLATVHGRAISGKKGAMLEGGSRVPLIVNWPGMTPAGKVLGDLTDFSDFLPTLAEIAGAKLPAATIDGRSFAPQIQGQPGEPRDWVYVQLEAKIYVRSDRWKLTGDGKLFDMKEAPFQELGIPATTTDSEALAARTRLQAVLDTLRSQE